MPPSASLLVILGLILVHLFSAELPFLARATRNRWLSLAAGVPVAFVFLQILPALGRDQQTVVAAVGVLKNQLYLVALAGLATFAGVEQAIQASRRRNRVAGAGNATSGGVFWLSITSYAGVNAIIGYLLLREERTPRGLILFGVAMALKFMVDDYGLHKDHRRAYDRQGRWIVAGALLFGWAIAYLAAVPPVAVAMLRGFLAGGILLNVLKEVLPMLRETGFAPFLLGITLYAAMLLFV
jgi:hypothetical protein